MALTIPSPSRPVRLRAAGTMLAVIGIGHGALGLYVSRRQYAAWARRGWWSTVPLTSSGPDGRERGVDGLRDQAAYWAGIGSFAVPTAVLGGLLWYLADADVAVPRWVGWAIAGWSAAAGVILAPAPWPVITAGGVLVALPQEPRQP